MNRQQLLESLTQDILAYVMHGNFPEHELANRLKLEGLDQRFDEYELLLDLHFVLRNDVIEFVEELPKRLRNIRTESKSVSRRRQGEVRGRINWGDTVKARYRGNPRDPSVFVCEDHTADYDIPENLVVKSLLDVIHRTLQEAEGYLNADYEWVSQTWKGNENLISEFQRIVERNVHILRIREPKVTEPTDRMLSQAAQARQDVYRDAASLVRQRHRLHRGERDAIRALLDQTAIMPDDMSKLYELYVLFQMVGTLEQLVDASPVFKTIASDRQELVRMDGEPEVVLYHDSTPDDPDIDFIPVVGDAETQSRSDIVQQESMQIASDYFREHSFHDATGRPDVLILKVRHGSEEPANYLITEVKYSSNRKTVRRGIKETIEYLAFLRLDGEYVFGDEVGNPTFGDGWNGLLVTLDLEEETQSLAEQRSGKNSVKILQASEIDDHLEEILEQVLV